MFRTGNWDVALDYNTTHYVAKVGGEVVAAVPALSDYGDLFSPHTNPALNNVSHPTDYTWQHVALVVNGSQLSVYRHEGGGDSNSNLAFVAHANITFFTLNFSPLQLDVFVFGEYFSGKMDEIRVWNVSQSQSVLEKYKSMPYPCDPAYPASLLGPYFSFSFDFSVFRLSFFLLLLLHLPP